MTHPSHPPAPSADPVLTRLQSWYASMCNDSWEHAHGVRIDTLDNPGWLVRIELGGAVLPAESFQPVIIDRSDSDWVRCRVEDGSFQATGGVANLLEILEIFLRFAGA
ncbi:immunity 53 family protein [Nannocystis punicea]|uniref:Immunity 53 family protein n=1 Tax=Nannocystis punicea TaxID=2995304 RepID=A0ABY7H380_9BACT|nr:immunity 53 family protein [Nannocystis poenicansa]WAS93736.1 immunity 53 family protein [Nannocystis poenicansa]